LNLFLVGLIIGAIGLGNGLAALGLGCQIALLAHRERLDG
jgi:hypothetical protein